MYHHGEWHSLFVRRCDFYVDSERSMETTKPAWTDPQFIDRLQKLLFKLSMFEDVVWFSNRSQQGFFGDSYDILQARTNSDTDHNRRFGDHTGFYSLPDRYPIVEVTAVTHRRNAIYPTTIVGPPPMEDYYLGKATERIFLPLLKTIVHDIDDYHLPMFGCFHNCAAIRIKKAYGLQGRRVMHSIWGAGQMAWTKAIIVVDEQADVHDEKGLFRTMMEQCDFRRDIEFVNGPLDILDQAAPQLGAGTKIGFDATNKIEGDGIDGRSLLPPRVDDSSTHEAAAGRLRSKMNVAWHLPEWGARRLLVLGLEPGLDGETIRAHVKEAWNTVGPESSAADLVLAVDSETDLDDFDRVLFNWMSCADPGGDSFFDGSTGQRRIAFDATTKAPGRRPCGSAIRDFAPYLNMDEETKALVTNRWEEYGLGGTSESKS